MTDRIYTVLFLCTGNSARSILAESLVNHWGRGTFQGFSAGSFPKGQVHPFAMDLLKRMNMPADNLRSKSWDEFASAGAPTIMAERLAAGNTAILDETVKAILPGLA